MGVCSTTYAGSVSLVRFYKEEPSLKATIETNSLFLRSVKAPKDFDHYAELFGDTTVVEKYHDGKPKSREYIEDRIQNIWAKRWSEGDPYSAFAVFGKTEHEESLRASFDEKPTDVFLGHIVLGHGDRPGQSELAGLGVADHWDMGLGQEAAYAIVRDYAPAIIEEGYSLEGKPLEEITATTRTDNEPAIRILDFIGMHKVGEEEKFGNQRYLYSIDTNTLYQPQKLTSS